MMGILHDEIGVRGVGDRAAMRENQDVRIDAECRSCPGVDALGTVYELWCGLRTDRSAGSEAEVTDDDVGTGDGHRRRFLFTEDIGGCQHVLFVRLGDHFDLQRIGHAGFLEIGTEDPVDQADCRKILHAREAERLQLIKEKVHVAERVGAVDTGEHRRSRDDGEHFAGHLQHDRVGITIRHQAGERATAGHAVAAGVVDDDQVDAACLFTLGRQAGAGAAADNRFSSCGHVPKVFQKRRSFKPGHASPRHSPTSSCAPEQGSKRADNGGGELGIVDVLFDANELTVCGLTQRSLQCAEQRRVGFRIPEGSTGCIEC